MQFVFVLTQYEHGYARSHLIFRRRHSRHERPAATTLCEDISKSCDPGQSCKSINECFVNNEKLRRRVGGGPPIGYCGESGGLSRICQADSGNAYKTEK